jgi:hypothetical protein
MPETHDYECPDCGFTSTGWPSAEARDARGMQHLDEHETGVAMPELADFNQEG